MSLRIAIIGAGMAGVSPGRLLADRGHRVTLLEKSRGCGGRCANKRWEGHTVDHGAQYFTLRHPDSALAAPNFQCLDSCHPSRLRPGYLPNSVSFLTPQSVLDYGRSYLETRIGKRIRRSLELWCAILCQ